MPKTSEMFYPYSGSTVFMAGQRVYSLVSPSNPYPANFVKVGQVTDTPASMSRASGSAPQMWFHEVRWDIDSTTEMVPNTSMSLYPPPPQVRFPF